jgi:hypothetical protein
MMAEARDSSTVYQKEHLGIAVYDNNREPDGNPDEVREFVKYWRVEEVRMPDGGTSMHQVEVTDPEEIAEIERRIAEKQE